MLEEFGQAPLCLELDLDSFEGHSSHVAAFRDGSGWLVAARGTIQSAHDLIRATLIAACDEQENPIPAWRAVHLTKCGWSNLEDCREQPPEVLDDMLCEEEGALYARWQREMNGDLASLADRAQQRIEALEARTKTAVRDADRQVAELRRRRRLFDATPEHRQTLDTLIAEIEAESDATHARMTTTRAVLRRITADAEEALWDRADILLEVEPLYCVRWHAASRRISHRPNVRSGGIGFGYAQAPSRAQWRYAQFMQSEEVVADRKGRLEQASSDLRAADIALEFLQTRLKAAQNGRSGASTIVEATQAVRNQRLRVKDLKARRAALYREITAKP